MQVTPMGGSLAVSSLFSCDFAQRASISELQRNTARPLRDRNLVLLARRVVKRGLEVQKVCTCARV